ncbi:MAG: DUF87 domain-containing protein [Candidatus Micrarchaeota archaeon]
MGNLNLQKLLSSEIGSRRFLLRPAEPAPEDLLGIPGDGIYLGRTEMLNTPVFWNFKTLANPHLAVVGMTGSGKSYFIKTFLTRASRAWGANALILDWTGEYTPWVKNADGLTIHLGKQHSLNLLDCRQAYPSASKSAPSPHITKKSISTRKLALKKSKLARKSATPRSQIERIISALSILSPISIPPRQIRYIKTALEQAYAKKRLNLDNPLPPSTSYKKIPTLLDALQIIKIQLKKSKDNDLESAYLQIEKFCTPGASYFSKQGGIQLDELVDRGLVSIDLSSLPTDAHRSLAGLVILQFLKERMRDEGWSSHKQLKLFVVADEAWKIVQDERSDLVHILREGRKYAFSLIVASQNPTDISKTILSNVACLAVFRLMHSDFRSPLLNSLHCNENVSIQIEKFMVGQALFRFAWEKPGLYDGPFIISRIEGEEPEPVFYLEVGKMDIKIEKDQLQKRLWRLGCTNTQISQITSLFEQNDFKANVEDLAGRLLAFGFSRSIILSFLRELGISDSALLNLFSRLQARSLGVHPNQLANLVVKDEKA